jgi:hypothetical protein
VITYKEGKSVIFLLCGYQAKINELIFQLILPETDFSPSQAHEVCHKAEYCDFAHGFLLSRTKLLCETKLCVCMKSDI